MQSSYVRPTPERCVSILHCRVSRLLRVVPHLLTLTNLAAGCVACIALIRGEFWLVPWCLLVSAVADFLDGFAARAAGVSGPFGRELDSLADMVSFGVSPGLMAFAMLDVGFGLLGSIGLSGDGLPTVTTDLNSVIGWSKDPARSVFSFLSLSIPVLSAVRLARFNVEQSDTKHFVGLATPANTLFWFGLFMTWYTDSRGLRQNLSLPIVILPLVALTSYLLVSDFTYFSNKLNPLAARNWPVWVVALAFVVLPWFIGWAAIPVAMGLYILSALVWRPETAAT